MNHNWTPELWMAFPFLGLLLAIAILPIVAHGFWHKLRNQAIVSIFLALPILMVYGKHEPQLLIEQIRDYLSFVILLSSLYTVSGGIHIAGSLKSTPAANTLLLGIGAVLSNFIGTTGASMVLIRPLLHANDHRKHHVHLPIFFIFLVSNIGGALTPLGDPPLFLGFLNGIPFFWTLRLFPVWITAVAILLAVFYFTDRTILRREKTPSPSPLPLKKGGEDKGEGVVQLKGKRNFFCFAAILVAMFLPLPYREAVMITAAVVSVWITPKRYHDANAFSHLPMLEVAIIFLGIFITMVPALQLLRMYGSELGVNQPWQFFWATGGFSSFLDNAPTYMTFGALAQGLRIGGPYWGIPEKLLMAISAGAVFFGAMTYIGNAPNFMVRSISQHRGWKMPSFFGYMLWSAAILLPLFFILTLIFFR
ncbi:MAG: sodium:proton antiporter [Candidatus Omnitrophota bacterium]